MIRQYIGARYVTKVYENSLDPSSAEWESGVTYEPLTLVTYLNSSYLSKKEVPGAIGNPAANPSYWVVTGAYNGQIATLQNQIDAINASLTPLLADEIVIFGDSWSDPLDSHAWAEQLATNANLTIYNFANAGKSYTNPDPDRTIDREMDWAQARINNNTIDPNKIGKVFFIAGMNDAVLGTAPADVVTAMLAAATRAEGMFPNAEIIFVFNSAIGYMATAYSTQTYRNYSMNICNGIASYYPIYNSIAWFNPSDFGSDGMHLTANNKNMQRNILALIKNESCDDHFTYSGLITQVDGLGGAFHLFCDSKTSMLTVRIDKVATLAAGSYSVSIPDFVLFDAYGGRIAQAVKSDGTIIQVAVYTDNANNRITFDLTAAATVHFVLPLIGG